MKECYCVNEIQGLHHPGRLSYVVSVSPAILNPSESALALIPLAPNRHVSFKIWSQVWTEFSILYISMQINCHRISECSLYFTIRYSSVATAPHALQSERLQHG
jgi:hypothetical protein